MANFEAASCRAGVLRRGMLQGVRGLSPSLPAVQVDATVHPASRAPARTMKLVCARRCALYPALRLSYPFRNRKSALPGVRRVLGDMKDARIDRAWFLHSWGSKPFSRAALAGDQLTPSKRVDWSSSNECISPLRTSTSTARLCPRIMGPGAGSLRGWTLDEEGMKVRGCLVFRSMSTSPSQP
ncbi:hypothetical protein K523DRAFT_61950 [Schizophyllum commune Tattone D]|nr:hypothetical protein K523DRAFT_61950 [Schizophyllum commune Tattone D]